MGNMLILAQIKLGFAIDTIVEAHERMGQKMQQKFKNHRKMMEEEEDENMEEERLLKMIKDDMEMDSVFTTFGSYLKHMVIMDLEPITSLAGEGEEGMEVRGRAFHAAIKAHHWNFKDMLKDSWQRNEKMKPDEIVEITPKNNQGPANITSLAN